MDAGRRAFLDSLDWNELGRRGVAYELKLAARKGMNGRYCLGASPGDVTQEVIVKLYAGKRTWDPAKTEFIQAFYGMIRSEMHHLAQRVQREQTGSAEDAAADADRSAGADDDDPPPSPEDAVLAAEEWTAEKTLRWIETACRQSADEGLIAVIRAVRTGAASRRAELAEALDVPATEIDNRLKRLRRIALTRPEELPEYLRGEASIVALPARRGDG